MNTYRKLKFYALLSTIAALAIVTAIMIPRVFRSLQPERELAVLPVKADYLPIPGIEEIRGYKKWHRVNATPVIMDHDTAMLCTTIPVSDVLSSPSNPHKSKYFTVYVNSPGQKAMSASRKKIFPVGSIIVKEKLPSKTSKSPELLTVMIKRQKGYNKAGGDWEYLTLNGPATKIESRGKLEKCQSCHASREVSDYVFGSYYDSPKLW